MEIYYKAALIRRENFQGSFVFLAKHKPYEKSEAACGGQGCGGNGEA